MRMKRFAPDVSSIVGLAQRAFDQMEVHGVLAVPLRSWIIPALGALALLAAGTPARAQIGLPQTPTLPGGLPGARLPDRLPVDPSDLEGRLRSEADRLLQAPGRFRDLIRRADGALEADKNGWPVVRSELLAVDPSAQGRREMAEAGFSVVREERVAGLDLTVLVLAPPPRTSLRRALERLRRMDPTGTYELNHVYAPSGEVGAAEAAEAVSAPAGVARPRQGGGRLGLIDTGLDRRHPAIAGASIRERGFAGAVRSGAHGTAVASLLVGRSGAFSGAAPGAELWAADVYGGSPAGGSSTAVAQALGWMAGNDVTVVNVSLVGPRNALVEAAIQRASARGVLIVAAVGNDGPAAPPLYPASFPEVVGVTAVNARGRVLPEAGRGPQVDFAAPGAEMAAAGPGQGYVSVRGSSFAAPLVAGLLVREGRVAALEAGAQDLGARGRDPVYGAGLVAADRRIAPQTVGARGRLTR